MANSTAKWIILIVVIVILVPLIIAASVMAIEYYRKKKTGQKIAAIQAGAALNPRYPNNSSAPGPLPPNTCQGGGSFPPGPIPIPSDEAALNFMKTGKYYVPYRRPVNTYLYIDAPEYMKVRLGLNAPVAVGPAITVPQSFDCRVQWPTFITGPLDQGQCGNCWAESTATSISDRYRIFEQTPELMKMISYTPFKVPGEPTYTYQVLNNLSPWQLVYQDECGAVGLGSETDAHCSLGCNGGYVGNAMVWVHKNGLSSLQCFPPNCDPAVDSCPAASNQPPAICASYLPTHVHRVFHDSSSDADRISMVQQNLVTYGPAVLTYNVYESFYDFFEKNPKGIYTQSVMDSYGDDTLAGGHAVSVIGYGTGPDPEQNGKTVDYWLIRNSWGPNWGDSGYFKIQNDICELLNECWGAYPIETNPTFPPPLVDIEHGDT
jgi:hypothetical protein